MRTAGRDPGNAAPPGRASRPAQLLKPGPRAQHNPKLGAPALLVLMVPANWQLMLCTQSSATAQLGGARQSLGRLRDKPWLCPSSAPCAHSHPDAAARSAIWEPKRPTALGRSPGACFLPFHTGSHTSSSLGLLGLVALFLVAAPLNLNISPANLNRPVCTCRQNVNDEK